MQGNHSTNSTNSPTFPWLSSHLQKTQRQEPCSVSITRLRLWLTYCMTSRLTNRSPVIDNRSITRRVWFWIQNAAKPFANNDRQQIAPKIIKRQSS